MTSVTHALLVLALMTAGSQNSPSTVTTSPSISSSNPVYELSLPAGYVAVVPLETPARYIRSCGRESWARLSVVVVDSKEVLPQNVSGVRAEDVQSRVPFPPEAKWTFQPMRWKDFDIGSFEYRAVVKDLPVLGIAAVLPLQGGSLTILVYAPEPLEKECREEFGGIFARFTKAPTSWHSAEYYQQVRRMNRVAAAGGVMMVLYVVAWAIFFRDDPLRAHWLRTAWLVVNAVLLFLPITSPGEMTFTNNLAVNLMVPLVLLMFAARRIKVGIEMS